jgi:hypothetical protein
MRFTTLGAPLVIDNFDDATLESNGQLMGYWTTAPNSTLAATLVYWLHRQGEPVGLRVVGGEGMPHAEIPPGRGRSHLQLMFLVLASARPAGRAELATALADVGGRTRRRSLVLVLSDGMEEPERWLPSLGAFARRGTDLRFLHLYDPAELRMERDLVTRCFDAPHLGRRGASSETVEGIRALAIDKDHLPVWQPAGVEEIGPEVVEHFFSQVWTPEAHPLRSLR